MNRQSIYPAKVTASQEKYCVTILVLLLLFVSVNASAQADQTFLNGFELCIETGYMIPVKESFRSNYDRGFFIGNTKIPPFFLGVGAAYFVSSSTCMYIESRRVNNLLSSNDRISIAIVPVLLGVRHYLHESVIDMSPLRAFVGGGAGFYWARTSVQYLTSGIGPNTIVDAEDAINQYGFGAQAEMGIDIPTSDYLSFGMRLTFDINHLGRASAGGLGDLGGLGVAGTFRIKTE